MAKKKYSSTKVYLIISAVFCIPLFLTSLTIGYIGMENLIGGKMMTMIMTGQVNNKFLAWMFMCSGVGYSFVLTSILLVCHKADKIDELDEAIMEANNARNKYLKAADELVNK